MGKTQFFSGRLLGIAGVCVYVYQNCSEVMCRAVEVPCVCCEVLQAAVR